MNPREKVMSMLVVGLVGLLVIFVSGKKLVVQPWQDLNQQIDSLQTQNANLETENQKAGVYKEMLDDYSRRSLGDDPNEVRERFRERLTMFMIRSGVSQNAITLTQLTGVKVKNGVEVGWNVRASGTMHAVVSFLYLMQQDKYLHRVDNLVISPSSGGGGECDMTARVVTLAMGKRPGVQQGELKEMDQNILEEKTRREYALIESRDLFRPYVKRVVQQQRPDQRPTNPTPPQPPREVYQVVGLPTWSGEPEAWVKDMRSQRTQCLNMGQKLMEMRVVMVDYRPLPDPRKPEVLSPSRLILESKGAYYAIELGQTTDQKHAMQENQWPEGLKEARGHEHEAQASEQHSAAAAPPAS